VAPMDVELNLGMFLEHAIQHAGDVEIVTHEPGGHIRRYTHQAFGRRTNQLMHALDRLGVDRGEAVGTLAWNHDRHLEVYFAVPCSGRVLHTLNPRLGLDDLAWTMQKVGDKVIFVDPDFVPLLARVPQAMVNVKAVVVMGDPSPHDLGCTVIGYDDLVADESQSYDLPDTPERSPSGICFTTGTTGRPKGVVYTHRSSVLHAMGVASGAGLAVGPGDCVCVQVPMFHANSFGVPYAALAVGAKQVLNSGPFDPSSFVDLLISERVTVSAGVVTVWQMVAVDLKKRGLRIPNLRHLLTAGTRPPASLIETYFTEFGIPMLQGFGMTEASPLVGVAWPKHHMRDWDVAEINSRVRRQAAIPLAGVTVALRDDNGDAVPWDGSSMGHLLLRGPWIAGSYLGADSGAEHFTDDGYFDTGDVAIGTPDGYLSITDRIKDMVKSGGEWIPSVDMENAIVAMPEVSEAAVIAIPDVKWGERPLACIVGFDDAKITLGEVHGHLEASGFPRWQLPDRIELLPEMPRTSVGKVDKKFLRAKYATT
jgi:fatty-acyl-CoA synthase